MKTTKRGDPIISHDTFVMAAALHQQIAEKLQGVVTRSLARLEATIAEPVPADTTLADQILDELESVFYVLGTIEKRHLVAAESSQSSALMSAKRGPKPRPKVKPTSNALQALQPGYVLRKKRGRKLRADISDSELRGALNEGASEGRKTERETLEYVARLIHEHEGLNTAGERLKKLIANLQKRVATARAAVRGSSGQIEQNKTFISE